MRVRVARAGVYVDGWLPRKQRWGGQCVSFLWGSIEFVKPSTDARDAIKAVFDAWRHRQPGELRRRDFGWDFDLGLRESARGPT